MSTGCLLHHCPNTRAHLVFRHPSEGLPISRLGPPDDGRLLSVNRIVCAALTAVGRPPRSQGFGPIGS